MILENAIGFGDVFVPTSHVDGSRRQRKEKRPWGGMLQASYGFVFSLIH